MATELNEETVLSDVHVTTIPWPCITEGNGHKRRSFTRFVLNRDPQAQAHGRSQGGSKARETNIETDLMTDEDGDLVLTRKQASIESDVITITHSMQTSLADVGLQVWMGCLLLCNFIIHNHQRFEMATVLEMGGGTGLTSIVMATAAEFVICTDIGKDVLEMCEKNIGANRHIYNRGSEEAEIDGHIIVRDLDWTSLTIKTDESVPFSWRQKDLQYLDDVDVLIAADVIYSNDLTDAFFMKLQDLMRIGKPKTCFIATEKRLNFTVSDLEVTCKEYDHFREWLDRLETTATFLVKKLDSEIPHFLHYPHSVHLELWEIQRIPM